MGVGQALDKTASLDTFRYISQSASRDVSYCPQLQECHLQNKEQMVQTSTIHGAWIPLVLWLFGSN